MPSKWTLPGILGAAVLAALWGCGQAPDYPVPRQMPTRNHMQPALPSLRIRMDELADKDILAGVLKPEPGLDWRWTRAHPRVRFAPDAAEGWQLRVKFTVIQAVLDKIGPQQVTILLNGHPLGSLHCARPGGMEFDALVPAGLLRTDIANIAGLDIQPVADFDGEELGVALQEMTLRWTVQR